MAQKYFLSGQEVFIAKNEVFCRVGLEVFIFQADRQIAKRDI